jgi:hypothetical protein
MFNVLGMVTVLGYFYVAALSGRASRKAGHSGVGVLINALTWPVMMWKVIEDLYKV